MSWVGSLVDDLGDATDEDDEHKTWLMLPVACVILLTAGVVAGVVRALRADGSDRCAGVPLPRCSWLTARWAVRGAAWLTLIVGLFGILSAARHFVLGWRRTVPPYLLSFTLAAYLLLASAPLFTLLGLRVKARGRHEGHEAYRQAARAALMGGLASGLATEVLCNAGESEHFVPHEWSQGCGMLGASSGFLLLGLYAAQADGAWDEGGSGRSRDRSSASDEARGGDAPGGPGEIRSFSRRAGSFFSERWRVDTEETSYRDGLVTRQDSEDSRIDLGHETAHRSLLGNFRMRPSWHAWGSAAQARDPSTGDLPTPFGGMSGRHDATGSLDEPLLHTVASGCLLPELAGFDAPTATRSVPGPLAPPPPPPHAGPSAAAEGCLAGSPCHAAVGASGSCGPTGGGSAGPYGTGTAAAAASSTACGSFGTLGPPTGHFPREPALLPVLAA